MKRKWRAGFDIFIVKLSPIATERAEWVEASERVTSNDAQAKFFE